MKLATSVEHERIRRFTRAFRIQSRHVTLGIGDDGALLRVPPRQDLVVTTDSVVEGVHFSKAFTPEEIGHKALAVNLSDLAAMGAIALGFVCAIEVPSRAADPLPGIARGMSALARAHGIPLVGGNLTRGSALALTITAMGRIERDRVLRRDGAQPGDVLLVSGRLGGAARGLRRHAPAACLRRQRRPRPLMALGWVAAGQATAGIDISDGLIQDLGHVLRASGVAAHLNAGAVPLQHGATLADALSGGEDYELLLTANPHEVEALCTAAAGCGSRLTSIGWCTPGRPGGVTWEGGAPQLDRAGHDHFG